ncbi:MAG: hypothetical protein KDI03_14955 [Anaerolineae bacterium]|nr:hypothetical protein [Anaerolineae bacterium]
MGNLTIPSDLHFVKGLDPVADAFSGTVYSDIIEVMGEGICFLVYKGVGTTGTSTLTVEACDDVSASNSTAVVFWYKRVGTTDSGWTAATTSGFATTAGSSDMYLIAAPKDVFASTGYKYARLKAVEVANDPVLGGIAAFVYGLRYGPQPTSLVD